MWFRFIVIILVFLNILGALLLWNLRQENNKLDIINYSKILDFSDTKISISYFNNIYIINGSNLVISKMMEEELLSTGNIESISFNK